MSLFSTSQAAIRLALPALAEVDAALRRHVGLGEDRRARSQVDALSPDGSQELEAPARLAEDPLRRAVVEARESVPERISSQLQTFHENRQAS